MKSEAAAVLAIAGGDVERARAALTSRTDWGLVRRLAAVHHVDPLCHWRCAQQEPLARLVPEPVRAKWKTTHALIDLGNRVLVEQMATVQEAIARRGADMLVLKGAWLAHAAYPDPGTRQVGDLDLYVREHDFPATVAALTECGYRSAAPIPQDPSAALAHAHYVGQLRFVSPGRRMIEVHFRLVGMGPPSPSEDWVWRESRRFEAYGVSLWAPGPEAMLLHVALHANQHGFTMLRLLHDIRNALAKDGPPKEDGTFLSEIGRLRCSTSARYALLLARDLAGAVVPERLLRSLNAGRLRRRLYETAWDIAGVRSLHARSWPHEFESPRFYLLEMGTMQQKLGYLAQTFRKGGGLGTNLRRVAAAIGGEAPARGA